MANPVAAVIGGAIGGLALYVAGSWVFSTPAMATPVKPTTPTSPTTARTPVTGLEFSPLPIAPIATTSLTREPASAFLARTSGLSESRREREIIAAAALGNVPSWTWQLVDVVIPATRTAPQRTLRVMPDFFAIGTDTDFARVPLSPDGAASVFAMHGLRFPTIAEVEAIHSSAAARGGFVPFDDWEPRPGASRSSNIAIAESNAAAERRRAGRGGLLDGEMKYVLGKVHSAAENRDKVRIYGGWYADGRRVQPDSTIHIASYLDRSHGIRGVVG